MEAPSTEAEADTTSEVPTPEVPTPEVPKAEALKPTPAPQGELAFNGEAQDSGGKA